MGPRFSNAPAARAAAILAGIGLTLLAADARAQAPNASVTISGGCYYAGGVGTYNLNWYQANTTGAPESFNYFDGSPADPGIQATAFASGEQRRSAVGWTVAKKERAQTLANCWANDNQFTNTFIVEASPGSGLNPGDPVTLVLRPSVHGSMSVGNTAPAEGGLWNSYGEVEFWVDAETEGGTWLASYSAFANLNSKARGPGEPGYPNGVVVEDWYKQWDWESNTVGFFRDSVSSQSVLCTSWSAVSGCLGLSSGGARGLSESPSVAFEAKVGDRVTVSGWLGFTSDVDQISGGGNDGNVNLTGLYATGGFLASGQGLQVNVTAETAGAVVTWDVGELQPSLSITDAAVDEGSTGSVPASFTVTLSAAAASAVTVDWATADVSATAGADYTSGSGTLTFAAGETSKTIEVAVLSDADTESDETFEVTLSNPTGATIADGTGVGTIHDTPPTVPPTLSGTPTSPATVGTAYSFAFTVTGQPAPTVTLSGGTALPPGLTLSTAGVLAGTPTTAGTYQFMVSADNGVPPAAPGSFTIVVNPQPTPPTLTGTPTSPATVGTAYSFVFTVTGEPAPTATRASGTLPPGLTLSSAGVLAGTPTMAGTYQFTVRAANGVAPDATSGTLAIVVNPQPADLRVSGSVAQSPIPRGGTAVVSFTVANSGPATAQGVVATFQPPARGTVTLPAGCTRGRGRAPITCALGDMAAGGATSLAFSISFRPSVNGTFTAGLTATSTTPDPDSTNNAATVPFTVGP